MESENARLTEVNEDLLNQKRQLEAEKDELEEMRGAGGGMSAEEKRRFETKIASLEEELEEEQSNCEVALDKQRKAQSQVSFLVFLFAHMFIYLLLPFLFHKISESHQVSFRSNS